MLARQDFGRRHERRLTAGLDHMRRGEQRDHGLAGADVAVQQAQHALRLRQIGDDVGDGAGLRRRQRIGQRRDDARAQPALGRAAAAGAAAHMRAQQRERELARQQFVISEPRPRRAFRLDVVGRRRTMHAAQRVGEARIGVALAPLRVLPFRQRRQAIERQVDAPCAPGSGAALR